MATIGGRASEVQLASGDVITTEKFVAAAGPALHDVGRMPGLELPLVHELHSKVLVRDTHAVVPRDAIATVVLIAWLLTSITRTGMVGPRAKA